MSLSSTHRWIHRSVRLAAVLIGLGLWFWSQSLIGRRSFDGSGIGDALHVWLAPLHAMLTANPQVADGLLIASSLGIDTFGLYLLLSSIIGSTIRPFLGLVVLFSLRQLCQALTALPSPEGMIWRDPGMPSLLVTYGVSNDLFFSGHTAIAVYGAIELWRRFGWHWVAVVGSGVALFEAGTVLALRAHYTMDVFTGAVTAGLVVILAGKLAQPVDTWLAHLGGRLRLKPPTS